MDRAFRLMFGDLDNAEAARGDARHPRTVGGVQSHVLLRRCANRVATKKAAKVKHRTEVLENLRERSARYVAQRLQLSFERNIRQIRLIVKHPSVTGLEKLARLASDLAQDDRVRTKAACAILRIAYGAAKPKKENTE